MGRLATAVSPPRWFREAAEIIPNPAVETGLEARMPGKTACLRLLTFHPPGERRRARPTSVIPAQEGVKRSPNRLKRLKPGKQRRPRGGGDPYKMLFQRQKWIPAFAGMTLVAHLRAWRFNFFTRSQAGIHAGQKHRRCIYLTWVPAVAGTTPRPVLTRIPRACRL
jgi:hypothetical protein